MTVSKSVLVTGAGGQLGQSLQLAAKHYPALRFHFCNSHQADITDPDSLNTLFGSLKPDYCINAAAYTAVDKAESEPEKAALVNVTGVENLAKACNGNGTVLLHISTDFVFDGTNKVPYIEEDATHPVSVYGKTKLQGEQVVATMLKAHYIIRTAWVYSGFANNFYKTMLRLGTAGTALKVVNDQRGTPTNANDLAAVLLHIVSNDKGQYGIYHYSNEGECSWYDFAKEIFRLGNLNVQLEPIPSSGYPTPAVRPVYSVLDKTKIKRGFGLTVPDWKESLANEISKQQSS